MRGKPEGFASVEEAADAVSQYLPDRPRPKDVSGLRRNLRPGPDGRLHWHWDPKFLDSRLQAHGHRQPGALRRRGRAGGRADAAGPGRQQ